MTTAQPPAWVDGDPLMEAIAAAVWDQCRTEGTSLVVDDPRNIAAVAAVVAVRLLGTDRCIHHVDTCRTHHNPATPVDGCPWCMDAGTAAVQVDRVQPTGEQL